MDEKKIEEFNRRTIGYRLRKMVERDKRQKRRTKQSSLGRFIELDELFKK